MTRMQAAAKAVLAGLGLAGAGMVLASFRYLPMRPLMSMMPEERIYALAGLVSAGLLAAGALVALWRLVGADGPAVRLAGEEGAVGAKASRGELAGALRLACVAAGLLLFSFYSEAVWETLTLAVFFFKNGREFFQSIIEGRSDRAWEMGFAGLKDLVYPIGLCAWIVYLLTGAERLVRELAGLTAGFHFDSSSEGRQA